MKLAEALAERKAIKTKMEDLKKRIYQNAKVQEGDVPIEAPLDLLEELERETAKFEEIIGRINRTNNETVLPDGSTLMEAIVKKDMLHYLHMVYLNMADKATPVHDRFNRREIKFIPTVDIGEIRRKADEIAREYRLLDMKIQKANWETDF
ncbi:MAG: DIP1984 family protein [Anaerolineales bacterium]|nr:DIP1984 family protein [Anaerolineales bacterium]